MRVGKKLVKSKRKIWLFAVGAITLLLLGLVVLSEETRQPTLQFGSRTLSVERAQTDNEREKGLSGREGITDNHAMLFVFKEKGKHCIWMKDMMFPIDILWLDENKKVLQIAASVPPESFPSNFCPEQDSSYVVEVQAGLSNKSDVDVGTQL